MKRLFGVLSGLFALALAVSAVGVGDKAPVVKVKEWVNGKGGNPAAPDGKTIYVVEFWATWCPPCRETIPRMNELYDEVKDQGVVVMGISDETADVVREFMKKLPMRYHVGIDDDQATGRRWRPEGGGIPHAYIVGKDGVVAWEGDPRFGLDQEVARMLAGTFDGARSQKVAALMTDLQKAQSLPEALKAVDGMLAADPGLVALWELKLQIAGGDPELTAATLQGWAKVGATDAAGQAALALAVLGSSAAFDPDLAYTMALKAATASQYENQRAVLALARTYHQLGFLDKARDALRQGVAARTKKGWTSPQLEAIQTLLDKIEAVRAKVK